MKQFLLVMLPILLALGASAQGAPCPLMSATTRDNDGNGLLDAVALLFDCGSEANLSDTMAHSLRVKRGDVVLAVDSMSTDSAWDTGALLCAHLAEDSTFGGQTGWRPMVEIGGMGDTGRVGDTALGALDGAGPVIRRVVHNVSRSCGHGTESHRLIELPHDPGCLTTRHFVAPRPDTGLITDRSESRNPVANRDRKVDLFVAPHSDGFFSSPNPTTPCLKRIPPGELYARHEPAARRWIMEDRSGYCLPLQLCVPMEGESRRVGMCVKIYDIVGNPVNAACNRDVLDFVTEATLSCKRTVDIYWNGTSAHGRPVDPGVYRVRVRVHYASPRYEDFAGSIDIGIRAYGDGPGDGKGGVCGSGVGLALIVPIWARICRKKRCLRGGKL